MAHTSSGNFADKNPWLQAKTKLDTSNPITGKTFIFEILIHRNLRSKGANQPTEQNQPIRRPLSAGLSSIKIPRPFVLWDDETRLGEISKVQSGTIVRIRHNQPQHFGSLC